MRTTIDLPDELMRAAKVRAAADGETLKDLFTRALEQELVHNTSPTGRRFRLPLIAPGAEPSVAVTPEQIADVLEAEDVERWAP